MFLFKTSRIIKIKIMNTILNNSINPIGSVVKLKFIKLLIISKESLRFIALKGIQNNETIMNVKIDDNIFDL